MAHQKAKTAYYSPLLFVLKNAAAFTPFIMVPFGLLARNGFVDSRFYINDGVFLVLVATYVAVSALWFLYLNKIPQTKAADVVFTALFHMLTTLFVLFVSGFLSAFLFVWVVLLIAADMRFKMHGFIASFAALCITGLLSILLHQDLSVKEQIEIIQGILIIGAIGFTIAKIRGITDRERVALAKTREQEAYQRERLLALVNSMGDAVVATDEFGSIKVYNSTLLSLLDTNLNLTGKSVDVVLKLVDSTGRRVRLVDEARNRKAVFSRTDLSYTFADGEVIKLYINVAPIHPAYRSHEESGFIFILRDITKEKSLEEERDEFISVVSHELRTPVAIAEGGLSNIVMLQERGASPDMLKKAAVAAHDQILYLSKLINDLSALSRAERGLGANIEVVDVTKSLQAIYNNNLAQAQAKNLKLDLDISSRLPHVVSSKLYIEEIVQNLVTNALKYTKEGGITIRAKQTKAGLIIEVEDTGIGISKSDQKHIFEKFYRSEDYRTRESSGTGLGLYVCKKLAEKIGLSLTFGSRLNHGSTFTVTVPPKQFATKGAKAGDHLA
ncbi:MAG TPA: ATP-binding protein [Candidatus Saccharimonadales bacterium]|nr:ATP-binding protein [Candidatus Saccharimonadales bacterium]